MKLTHAAVALCAIILPATTASGQAWSEMDYGPYLSMTIEAPQPAKNIAYKGIMVTLDEQSQTSVLFDTDLMRYAAGWEGGRIDWRSVVYDGSHGTHPKIVGRQRFGNAPRPGWSLTSSFDDPRKQPYGPLPHGRAHYRGLYLHDRQVVFSYTVGGTAVLDAPSLERAGTDPVFARTVEISRSTSDLTLQIAEAPGQPAVLINGRTRKPAGQRAAAEGHIAVLGRLAPPAQAAAEPVIPEDGLIARWAFDKKPDADAILSTDGTREMTVNSPRFTPHGSGQALSLDGRTQTSVAVDGDLTLGGRDYSLTAWVRTSGGGGTIAAVTSPGKWVSGGKTLFIRGGNLCFDVGWVGAVRSSARIADGEWHHVALTHGRDGQVALYVDGEESGSGRLESRADPKNSRLVCGITSADFPRGRENRLKGAIDDLCVFKRVLRPEEIRAMAPHTAAATITAAAILGARPEARLDVRNDSSIRLWVPNAGKDTRVKVLVWSGRPEDLDQFTAAVAQSELPQPLARFTEGGPSRFPDALTTQGRRGTGDKPWVVDELTPPTDNPWRSWLRFGGFDFFADSSRAAICTWNGDVWTVSGIDDSLDELRWRRIATGLFQPLGLKIVDETIYVCCRDQITILRDLNNDGEADFLENFNNDHQVTEHFHEFAMDLQTDRDGNFFYAKSARHALDSVVPHHGTLIRVSPDGRTSRIVCNGFRAANGVGIGPNGELATSDQEGHWTPANRINLVKAGGFYGNMYSFHRGERPTSYLPPVVWLPKNVDRSPAEQLWVTSDRWGPVAGNMLSTSYGTGQIFLVPYEHVGGVPQGGAVRLPLDFPTGTMRARFHPGDGQLYVCGLFGWSSNKTQPGGFYRVRYTGKPAHLPTAFHAAKNGLALTFSDPLDPAAAQDVNNYSLKQWNYRWSRNYGSPHLKVSNPRQEGSDPVSVRSATLLNDGRTVFLEIDPLEPVMQMQVSWSLRDLDGNRFRNDFYTTINRPGPRFDIKTAPASPGTLRPLRTRPGLIQRFAAGEQIDARISRLAALRVPAGEPPTPFVPANFFGATMEGLLNVELPGEYRFRLSGYGQAAGLRIDGQQVLFSDGGVPQRSSPPIVITRGPHTLELSFVPTRDAATSIGPDSVLRLEWASDSFGWEPVPPSALLHNAGDVGVARADSRRQARNLFATRGCAKCHSIEGASALPAMAEMQRAQPSLVHSAQRFRPDWVRDWILQPTRFRADARMPVVLHGDDTEANRQDAADVAAWLATLGDSPHEPRTVAATGGERLYEDLGCLACHRLTPPDRDDGWARRSLHHVDQKYRPGALAAFLKAPHAHDPWRRMPNFQLSDEEANTLAAWLRSVTPDPPERQLDGDPRRGRELFGSVGCSNCHATSERDAGGEMRGLRAQASGCLAGRPEQRGDAPVFGFTPPQRRQLMEFIHNDVPSLNIRVPVETATRTMATLDCVACHRRDADPGRFREIHAEESGTGRLPEHIPPLTWAGEKLHADWTQRFVSGELNQRLRPHLKIRMPRFGNFAGDLAAGLALQHGVSPAAAEPQPPSSRLAEIGNRLIEREGGFNCLQCHGRGDQKPTAAFDALGVDLEHIATRIRRPFYDRWMLNPPRIDPSTKMPQLTTNGRTTSVRDVLNGEAAPQFDAIWHALRAMQR